MNKRQILASLNDPDGITAYRAFSNATGGEADDEFTEPVDRTNLSSVMGPSVYSVAKYCVDNPLPQGTDDDFDCVANDVDACRDKPGEKNDDKNLNGCPPRFEAKDVVAYQMKEDWIFDKQRSQRFVRIVGIAPMYDADPSDAVTVRKPMFWLYYSQCRALFAEAECFNLMNDAFKGTFEDLFETRHFSAYVIKEENIYDRRIQDYAQGIDALLEGERIKKEIFEYEHDLWNY